MIRRLLLSLRADTPFKLAWLRSGHIKHGHTDSIRIDKLTSEKHPHSDSEFIFTINIMECKECGLIWNDSGVEHRLRIDDYIEQEKAKIKRQRDNKNQAD